MSSRELACISQFWSLGQLVSLRFDPKIAGFSKEILTVSIDLNLRALGRSQTAISSKATCLECKPTIIQRLNETDKQSMFMPWIEVRLHMFGWWRDVFRGDMRLLPWK